MSYGATPPLKPGDPMFSARKRAERMALLAFRAYPGPVGMLLARELNAWAAHGYPFGPDTLLEQCMTEIEKREHKHGEQERAG